MVKRIVSLPEPRRPLPLRRSSYRFAGRPASVKDARDWLDRRMSLAGIPEETADTARLLLSELATNNIKHAPARWGERGDFYVRAFLFHAWLRVEVRDANRRRPSLRVLAPEATAEGGRGLVLMSVLASRWGRYQSPLGLGTFFELCWDTPQFLAPVVPLPRKGR